MDAAFVGAADASLAAYANQSCVLVSPFGLAGFAGAWYRSHADLRVLFGLAGSPTKQMRSFPACNSLSREHGHASLLDREAHGRTTRLCLSDRVRSTAPYAMVFAESYGSIDLTNLKLRQARLTQDFAAG